MQLLVDGLGGIGADRLNTESPVQASGSVWYVSSVIGNDANAGTDRLRPFATLVAALAASTESDIIVLMVGHDEAADSIELDVAITIIGEGDASSASCAKLRLGHALNNLIVIDGRGVEIRNVRFAAATISTSGIRISVSSEGQDALFQNCYFELSSNEQGRTVSLFARSVRFDGCTFVVTATELPQPDVAIALASTGLEDIIIRDCIFDAGTLGWSGGYGVKNTVGDIANIRGEGITLRRGADILLRSGTTGYMNTSGSGGGRVVW